MALARSVGLTRSPPGASVQPGTISIQRIRRLLRGDAGWLLGVGFGLVLLCSLPYLVSAQLGPPDLERVGTFWFMRDFTQYAAAMREGARQTSWLVHDHFTAEPHAPALIYPLYVAAGKLAAAFNLGPLAIFGGLEWLGRIVLLLALWAFAATFLPDSRQRRLAVLLSAGTLGLAAWTLPVRFLLEAVGATGLSGQLPTTINVYLEMSSFGAFLSAPHLMLGLALTLLCAPLYIRARSGRLVWLVALGLAVLGLSLVHPFNLPVLVSILLLDAALSRSGWAWLAAGLAAVAAAPLALYNLLLFQTDAFWSGTYGAQNRMPAPLPWALPVDFGLVLLAAPLALRAMSYWPTERRRLILLWVGLGLVWMYAPVPYQRRFAFGVQPGLAALAAVGLVQLNAWLRARRVGWLGRRLLNYGLLVAALSTSVLVYVSLITSAASDAPAEVYLWSRSEAAAADWLADHSTETDVVLASTELANALVGHFDGRVVHGHIVATFHSDAKQALVRRFYAADASATERGDLLRASRATLVALGPRERSLGVVDLRGQPGLDLVYDRDGVQWFRVVP